MANGAWKNIKGPLVGQIDVDFSFPPGAAEDGTFPDSLLDDGYISKADGYGAVFGVLRVDEGNYKVILSGVFNKLIAGSITLECKSNKLAVGQFRFPSLMTETGTDGRKRSVVRIRIVGSAGDNLDLTYEDRIHVKLSLANSWDY